SPLGASPSLRTPSPASSNSEQIPERPESPAGDVELRDHIAVRYRECHPGSHWERVTMDSVPRHGVLQGAPLQLCRSAPGARHTSGEPSRYPGSAPAPVETHARFPASSSPTN